MKYIRLLCIAIMTSMAFVACDKENKTDNESPIDPVIAEGNTYRRSAALDANGTQQTLTLSDLNCKIETIQNSNKWLTVYAKNYISGSPEIELSATENTSHEQRQCSVTINATNGDIVMLSVTQEGAEELKTDIDDSHDVPTDKPAYVKQGAKS